MRRTILVLGVLTAAASSAAPAAGAPRPAASCTNVSAPITGVAIPVVDPAVGVVGFDVVATVAEGPLAGPVSASLTLDRQTAGGTQHLSGEHRFAASPYGPFTTSDRVVATASGRVHDTLRIVSGATGRLTTGGTIDFATGALTLRIHGRVCAG